MLMLAFLRSSPELSGCMSFKEICWVLFESPNAFFVLPAYLLASPVFCIRVFVLDM